MPFDYQAYPYRAAPGLSAPEPRHKVVIVGGGPIGLTMAIDLALRGIASAVLCESDKVSVGSRAICWAKRSLEIFDRIGVGDQMVAKGVTWKTGRLFNGDQEVYQFDLQPEPGQKMPAFVNLQQYYVEQMLIERIADFSNLIDLRWNNRLVGHRDEGAHVALSVETPDGPYDLSCDYLLACDGAKSLTRKRMGLRFAGETFEERFLIADVHMPKSPFGAPDQESDEDAAAERWFWFNPPFHDGRSALLHKQPDDIYRIDLQLGFDADPEQETRPENVIPRIEKMVGNRPFSLEWVSLYSFTCARLKDFVHNRVIFVGDSAHIVSPFGARGGNGGIQDVDNLGWKLAAVLQGRAGDNLLASYNEERTHGSDENILNSARATNFMTPKSEMENCFRNAVLDLAKTHPFARKLVNSGRLSVPCSLNGQSLQGEGADSLIGTVCADAPIDENKWLLSQINNLPKNAFTLLLPHGWKCPEREHLAVLQPGPTNEKFHSHYGGAASLIRPDQHIAARFACEAELATNLDAALSKALGF